MPEADRHRVERLLVRLIARAYAVDHPELFGPRLAEALGTDDSGVSSNSGPDTDAPPPNAGYPHDER